MIATVLLYVSCHTDSAADPPEAGLSDAEIADFIERARMCVHAPGLDAVKPGACLSRAAVLECELPGGGKLTCLSSDPTGCPGAEWNLRPMNCRNLCNANEYGVSCPSLDPNGKTPPPEGCRLGGPMTRPGQSYCCPCRE
jgi:hypothetical protein